MITVESRQYDWLADGKGFDRGQVFLIRVPDNDVIELDFNQQELDLIKKANDGDESPALMLRVLLMIVEKIDKRRELLKAGTHVAHSSYD